MIPALIFFLLHPHENKSQIMCAELNARRLFSEKYVVYSFRLAAGSIYFACFYTSSGINNLCFVRKRYPLKALPVFN